MEAKNFIYNELKVFIKKFSKTRVRYEYDQNALVHVVEVLPNEVYHLDNDYIYWENDLFNRFITQFPTENICFISDDALVGIEKPELVIEGLEYAPFSWVATSQKVTNTFSTNLNLFSTNSFDNINSFENKIESGFENIEIPISQILTILKAA